MRSPAVCHVILLVIHWLDHPIVNLELRANRESRCAERPSIGTRPTAPQKKNQLINQTSSISCNQYSCKRSIHPHTYTHTFDRIVRLLFENLSACVSILIIFLSRFFLFCFVFSRSFLDIFSGTLSRHIFPTLSQSFHLRIFYGTFSVFFPVLHYFTTLLEFVCGRA